MKTSNENTNVWRKENDENIVWKWISNEERKYEGKICQWNNGRRKMK
jgi:hypothetical protein